MRKLALALTALMLAAPAWGQVTNPLTRAGIGGIPDCKDARVFCVGKQAGAEYTTICGMTPGTGGANSCGDAQDVCTAASAMQAAVTAAGDGSGQPVVLRVGPGKWNECIAIDPNQPTPVASIDKFTLHLEPGAVVRPTVTAATDVNNGVIRVCNKSTARGSCKDITIVAHGATVQNDAVSSPEAALQGGRDGGPSSGAASPWDSIKVFGGTWISAHDGIQFFGSRLTTDYKVPHVITRDVLAISGSDACAKKGFMLWTGGPLECVSDSNYCEDAAQVAFLAAQSGTAQTGSATAHTVTLAAGQGGGTDIFVGRKVTLTGGTCGTGGAAAGQFWITDWNATTKVATVEATGALDDMAATGGSGTTIVWDDSGVDTWYKDWYVVVEAGSCSGQVRRVTAFDDASDTATVAAWAACTPDGTTVFDIRPFGAAPDSGCSYSIACVTHNDGTCYAATDTSFDTPCQDFDWTLMRAQTSAGGDGYWKGTGFHFGAGNSATTIPDGDGVASNGLVATVYLDDFGPQKSAYCTTTASGQSSIAGILVSSSGHSTAEFTNAKINMYINADTQDNPACLSPMGGLSHFLISGNAFENPLVFSGDIAVTNRGDSDTTIHGIAGRGNQAATVYAPRVSFDLNAIVGSVVHVVEADSKTIQLGRVASDTPIKQTGDPTWLFGQSSIASLGDRYAGGANSTPAWTSGDLYCTKATTTDGTATLVTGTLRVQTAAAGKFASICVYDSTGASLELKGENIDVGTTGGKSVTLSTAKSLPPGDHWLCIGSDATATLMMTGRPYTALGSTVAGKTTGGAATCPATITPGALVGPAAGTAMPELTLMP